MIRRLTGLLAISLALLSLPATAYTGSGTAPVMTIGTPSANCIGWPQCPVVLNSSAAPMYTLDPTVNASIQSLLTLLAAPLPLPTGASTSALQTTGNASAATTATNTGATSTATGTTADTAYTGTGATTVIGGLKGLYAKGGQNASIDGSTTQTTGGTAQVLFGGVTPGHGWKVGIPVAINLISTFACYVSDGTTTPSATTAGSNMAYAGGQYSTEPGQKPVGPVYVNCPTTGQPISAQMW